MRSFLVFLLLTASACGDGAASDAPPQVTGLITSIERDGGTITAFEVETEEGDRYRILLDPGRDYGFDLEHLVVHRDQSLPVQVRSERRGDDAVAVEILDA